MNAGSTGPEPAPFAEADLLPISALQHLLYCERQCALIHVERLWVENKFTAEGAVLHKRAHSGKSETRPSGRSVRGMPLRSFALGLFGFSDVVRQGADDGGGLVPVEYKRGKPKKNDCDRVQLCAQALCLEEMTGRAIPAAELFYGAVRRKVVVELTPELRKTTADAAARLHALIRSDRTPRAEYGRKCDRCSMIGLCLPRLPRRKSAKAFFDAAVDDPNHGDPPAS